jgi:hypothetical protein
MRWMVDVGREKERKRERKREREREREAFSFLCALSAAAICRQTSKYTKKEVTQARFLRVKNCRSANKTQKTGLKQAGK